MSWNSGQSRCWHRTVATPSVARSNVWLGFPSAIFVLRITKPLSCLVAANRKLCIKCSRDSDCCEGMRGAIRRRRLCDQTWDPTHRISASNVCWSDCIRVGDPQRRDGNRGRLSAGSTIIVSSAFAGPVCKMAGCRIGWDRRELRRQPGLRRMPSSLDARVQRHDDGQHSYKASAGFRRAARMRIVPWARQPVRSRNGSGIGQGRDG